MEPTLGAIVAYFPHVTDVDRHVRPAMIVELPETDYQRQHGMCLLMVCSPAGTRYVHNVPSSLDEGVPNTWTSKQFNTSNVPAKPSLDYQNDAREQLKKDRNAHKGTKPKEQGKVVTPGGQELKALTAELP